MPARQKSGSVSVPFIVLNIFLFFFFYYYFRVDHSVTYQLQQITFVSTAIWNYYKVFGCKRIITLRCMRKALFERFSQYSATLRILFHVFCNILVKLQISQNIQISNFLRYPQPRRYNRFHFSVTRTVGAVTLRILSLTTCPLCNKKKKNRNLQCLIAPTPVLILP